jgi:hypothetical protein
MQMANHWSRDKRTEKLMAQQVFGNNNAGLSGARRLEQAGGCSREAEGRRSLLAAIVKFSEDAIRFVNLDGTIPSRNAGAPCPYGFTEAEVPGKLITIMH